MPEEALHGPHRSERNDPKYLWHEVCYSTPICQIGQLPPQQEIFPEGIGYSFKWGAHDTFPEHCERWGIEYFDIEKVAFQVYTDQADLYEDLIHGLYVKIGGSLPRDYHLDTLPSHQGVCPPVMTFESPPETRAIALSRLTPETRAIALSRLTPDNCDFTVHALRPLRIFDQDTAKVLLRIYAHGRVKYEQS